MDSNKAITEAKKQLQRDNILLALLGHSCTCRDFMLRGIAQYNARIFELRKQGHNIIYDTKNKKFNYYGLKWQNL